MNTLIKDLTAGCQRYPNATRQLTLADVVRLDELFSRLNRMARTDVDWNTVENEIDSLLYV